MAVARSGCSCLQPKCFECMVTISCLTLATSQLCCQRRGVKPPCAAVLLAAPNRPAHQDWTPAPVGHKSLDIRPSFMAVPACALHIALTAARRPTDTHQGAAVRQHLELGHAGRVSRLRARSHLTALCNIELRLLCCPIRMCNAGGTHPSDRSSCIYHTGCTAHMYTDDMSGLVWHQLPECQCQGLRCTSMLLLFQFLRPELLLHL